MKIMVLIWHACEVVYRWLDNMNGSKLQFTHHQAHFRYFRFVSTIIVINPTVTSAAMQGLDLNYRPLG
ncbi:hypothetical protein Cantr_00563 [Candida viswanathii]|uniref:Uncharacterized protein n=1 Tax=Candida viswanathii TaxID=5486 RepID=A0A367YHT4_9ASCO|nr:hypothetical protein Cantr_00563 [Candida viswanathii]